VKASKCSRRRVAFSTYLYGGYNPNTFTQQSSVTNVNQRNDDFGEKVVLRGGTDCGLCGQASKAR
jgi:hypothetical protein